MYSGPGNVAQLSCIGSGPPVVSGMTLEEIGWSDPYKPNLTP